MSVTKQDKLERELEEMRKEMIEYLESINRKFSRIRFLEERFETMEEHLEFLRNKIRRIENMMYEYFSGKGAMEYKSMIEYDKKTTDATPPKSIDREGEKVIKIKEKTTEIEKDVTSKISHLTSTEKQILKILINNPEIKGGTLLAKKVGKAREHVSRLLKKLTEEGILIRDKGTWPYRYIVPEEIKQELMLNEEITN